LAAIAVPSHKPERPVSVRRRLFEQLDPAARPVDGLSALNWFLVIAICLSTLVAIIETEPDLLARYGRLFSLTELAFGLTFLMEYIARLWVAIESPRFSRMALPRLRYAMTPWALIDLIAIVPMLLELGASGSVVLRFFRILRILRLAKLGRMSRAWQHVSEAVHARRFELGLTLIFALIAMLVSATLLYWAEGEVQPDKFGSIPRSLWWSIVTLTTVGYGDVFPITPVGKFISALAAIAGIGIIAMPAGIMAAAFSDAIQQHRRSQDSTSDSSS
jgi:voltage-gated potassium channel